MRLWTASSGMQGEGGEEEAVEDHRADAHLGESDLAEEEAAAPEGAGEGAGGEAEGAVDRLGLGASTRRGSCWRGAMGAPALQPKAAAKPGWLTMTPSTRMWSGEWGSVSTCERTASGRVFSQ